MTRRIEEAKGKELSKLKEDTEAITIIFPGVYWSPLTYGMSSCSLSLQYRCRPGLHLQSTRTDEVRKEQSRYLVESLPRVEKLQKEVRDSVKFFDVFLIIFVDFDIFGVNRKLEVWFDLLMNISFLKVLIFTICLTLTIRREMLSEEFKTNYYDTKAAVSKEYEDNW